MFFKTGNTANIKITRWHSETNKSTLKPSAALLDRNYIPDNKKSGSFQINWIFWVGSDAHGSE